MYPIGIRVKYIEDRELAPSFSIMHGWCPDLLGKYGTVIAYDEDQNRIGIEFDEKFDGGHSCGASGKYKYCYWVKHQFIRPVNITLLSYEEML